MKIGVSYKVSKCVFFQLIMVDSKLSDKKVNKTPYYEHTDLGDLDLILVLKENYGGAYYCVSTKDKKTTWCGSTIDKALECRKEVTWHPAKAQLCPTVIEHVDDNDVAFLRTAHLYSAIKINGKEECFFINAPENPDKKEPKPPKEVVKKSYVKKQKAKPSITPWSFKKAST